MGIKSFLISIGTIFVIFLSNFFIFIYLDACSYAYYFKINKIKIEL
jgi:hypothetical protein